MVGIEKTHGKKGETRRYYKLKSFINHFTDGGEKVT